MLILDYKLDSAALQTAKALDLSRADSESLRYRLFLGDVFLRGEGADLSAPWGWVPVLDFALALASIAVALEHTRTETFEFTESDAVLEFARDGDQLQISSNYGRGVLKIPYFEFREKARTFAHKVIRELSIQHPSLVANPDLQPYLGSESLR